MLWYRTKKNEVYCVGRGFKIKNSFLNMILPIKPFISTGS